MKFRQRIAWVMLFGYLGVTLVTIYYLFELADQYNILSLEHTRLYHSREKQKIDREESLLSHLPDIPYLVWILFGVILYIQIFFVLYTCTKPHPKHYFLSCFLIFCKNYDDDRNKEVKSNQELKSENSVLSNGYINSLIL